MDQKTVSRDYLAKRIAGEIVLSHDPGKTIQKWRNIFKIPQRRLATQIGIMPSVISDYENGRRKSPGIVVIKRLISAMIAIDEKVGGKVIKEFSDFPTSTVLSDAVLDLKEFSAPVSIEHFCSKIGANMVIGKEMDPKDIHGYTVIDPLRAIIDLPPMELVKLYGITSERALVFCGAHKGKTSMAALKVTNLKPGLVVFCGGGVLDDLAKRIAESEAIPIATMRQSDKDDVLKRLKEHFGEH